MNAQQDIISRVGTLPPLPDTAVKLMEVINDPSSSVDEIVEVIRYDQAVTADVLKLCNSAYFGLSRNITSLNEAMLRLGTVKVLQLVMSVHTSSILANEQRGYGLDPGVLWRHSVAVALAASIVAQKINLTNVNLVFTGGLLHDIGKVVLNEYVAEEFGKILGLVKENRLSFVEAEHQVLGYSHQEIGGKIARMWKLPDPIVRCIRYHHDPGDLETPDPLIDAVYLANCVCLMLGIGLGEDGLYYRADETVLERNHLNERDLEDVGAQTVVDLQRVEELFASDATKSENGAPVG